MKSSGIKGTLFLRMAISVQNLGYRSFVFVVVMDCYAWTTHANSCKVSFLLILCIGVLYAGGWERIGCSLSWLQGATWMGSIILSRSTGTKPCCQDQYTKVSEGGVLFRNSRWPQKLLWSSILSSRIAEICLGNFVAYFVTIHFSYFSHHRSWF